MLHCTVLQIYPPLFWPQCLCCRIKGLKSKECVHKVVAALKEVRSPPDCCQSLLTVFHCSISDSVFESQVDGVRETESSRAMEEGLVTVAAHPDTLIRKLMEAVRKLVRHCQLQNRRPLHAYLACQPGQ